MVWKLKDILEVFLGIIGLVLPFFVVPQSITCIAQSGTFNNQGNISLSYGAGLYVNVGGTCQIFGTTTTSSVSLYLIPIMMIFISFGVYFLIDLYQKKKKHNPQ